MDLVCVCVCVLCVVSLCVVSLCLSLACGRNRRVVAAVGVGVGAGLGGSIVASSRDFPEVFFDSLPPGVGGNCP